MSKDAPSRDPAMPFCCRAARRLQERFIPLRSSDAARALQLEIALVLRTELRDGAMPPRELS